MFKIGDFSKICRIPVSALRYYADIGLLQPDQIDPATGYRYYSLDQLPRLNRILALRDLGLSLEQIRQVLHENLSAGEIRGMLRLKEAELQADLDERTARLQRVRVRLHQIEKEQITMPQQEVVLKEIEAQTVLSLREIAPRPESVGHLFEEIALVLMAEQVQVIAPPMTIFHDDEFKPENLDVEVIFPVADGANITLELERGRKVITRQLPALKTAASIIHTGDFDNLEETYSIIGKWIEVNGYSIAGQIREIYLRPPGMPDTQEEAITEIQFPVEKQP